mmetsp:Transcript_43915/g.125665  ORF Transcript_43915/g.125665 Transcript_43915/m.125665 type:complete len:264 (+) Transcript_43915:483-1274(+)
MGEQVGHAIAMHLEVPELCPANIKSLGEASDDAAIGQRIWPRPVCEHAAQQHIRSGGVADAQMGVSHGRVGNDVRFDSLRLHLRQPPGCARRIACSCASADDSSEGPVAEWDPKHGHPREPCLGPGEIPALSAAAQQHSATNDVGHDSITEHPKEPVLGSQPLTCTCVGVKQAGVGSASGLQTQANTDGKPKLRSHCVTGFRTRVQHDVPHAALQTNATFQNAAENQLSSARITGASPRHHRSAMRRLHTRWCISARTPPRPC